MLGQTLTFVVKGVPCPRGIIAVPHFKVKSLQPISIMGSLKCYLRLQYIQLSSEIRVWKYQDLCLS